MMKSPQISFSFLTFLCLLSGTEANYEQMSRYVLTYGNITEGDVVLATEVPKSFGPPLTFEESEALWRDYLNFEYSKALTSDVYPFILCDYSKGNSGYTRKTNILDTLSASEKSLGLSNSNQDDYDVINNNEVTCFIKTFSAKVLEQMFLDDYVAGNVLFAPFGFPFKITEIFYDKLDESFRTVSDFEDVTLIGSSCPGANVSTSENEIFSFMKMNDALGETKLESDSFFYQLVEENPTATLPVDAIFWHDMITKGPLNESNYGCKAIIQNVKITAFSSGVFLISHPLESTDGNEDKIACLWSATFALMMNPNFCSVEVDLSITIGNTVPSPNQGPEIEPPTVDDTPESNSSSSMLPFRTLLVLMFSCCFMIMLS